MSRLYEVIDSIEKGLVVDAEDLRFSVLLLNAALNDSHTSLKNEVRNNGGKDAAKRLECLLRNHKYILNKDLRKSIK